MRALLAYAALAAFAGSATAATPTFAGSARTAELTAGSAVERRCSARVVAPGRAGVARVAHRPGVSGLMTVRLRAARGDWDLAVFDAESHALVDASATFGPRETVTVPAGRGRALLVQACRRSGGARRARVTFAEWPLKAPAATAERVQMLRVPLSRPRDFERLEATGLDVTHSHTRAWADVVTYSEAERRRLLRAGFAYDVRIADMVAADRRALARPARASAAAPVPSGRTAYRTYAEYGEDLKALAAANPALVRPIEIGRSIEDRPIEGIEIATGVTRTDDGRATYVVMGLHHAREWPAGEMPMEFATDLLQRYPTDARVRALLGAVRVVILPVMNPDGFAVSRAAGPMPGDDQPFATLPQALADSAAYKRKNCRAPDPSSQGVPCSARPAAFGVDLNRNYGAYYGGEGTSEEPVAQNYRGTGPYSEPESEAFHRFSQLRNIVMVITHHTFTSNGVWLRQPGFCLEDPCDPSDVVPDEAGMKLLGDSMGEATGWSSQLGWAIGEITGATEDWNYFATGAYGYTPEQRGPNFHPSYDTAVAGEWPGVGEALLRAGEFAADRAWHAVIRGTAPAGRVLRLGKSFSTPTRLEGVAVAERLDLTLTVPATGAYVWDVNPSTRPLSPLPEAYTLTCEAPSGEVLESRQVTVARGQEAIADLGCGGRVRPSPGTAAPGGASGNAAPASRVRVRLLTSAARARSFARRPRVALQVSGGRINGARLALLDARGRTLASARRSTLRARMTVTLRLGAKARRLLRPGRYRLRVTGRDSAGRRVRSTRALRLH